MPATLILRNGVNVFVALVICATLVLTVLCKARLLKTVFNYKNDVLLET